MAKTDQCLINWAILAFPRHLNLRCVGLGSTYLQLNSRFGPSRHNRHLWACRRFFTVLSLGLLWAWLFTFYLVLQAEAAPQFRIWCAISALQVQKSTDEIAICTHLIQLKPLYNKWAFRSACLKVQPSCQRASSAGYFAPGNRWEIQFAEWQRTSTFWQVSLCLQQVDFVKSTTCLRGITHIALYYYHRNYIFLVNEIFAFILCLTVRSLSLPLILLLAFAQNAEETQV